MYCLLKILKNNKTDKKSIGFLYNHHMLENMNIRDQILHKGGCSFYPSLVL